MALNIHRIIAVYARKHHHRIIRLQAGILQCILDCAECGRFGLAVKIRLAVVAVINIPCVRRCA